MWRILVIFVLVISVLPLSVGFAQEESCDANTDYLQAALEAQDTEDWQGVLDAANCLIEFDVTDPDGYYYRGVGYYYLEEDVLALESFALLLAQNPADSSYAENILYYYTQEEIDSAVAALTPTETLTPTPVTCDSSTDYVGNGWDALDSGDYATAVTALTCALERDIEDSVELAEIYRLRGEAYQLLGDDTNAIVDLNQAITLYQGDWYAYLLRGISSMYLEDDASAQTDFATALELDPENDFIWYYVGLENHYTGDDTAAIEAFTRSLELNPDNSLAYAFRAQSHFILEDDTNALADIASAIELGEEPLAYLIWGQILYYQGEFESALTALDQAIELGAENPDLLADAYNYRGQVYYYLEEDDAAIDDLSQAVSYGEGVEAEDMLGEAYGYRGQSKLAIDDAVSATKDLNYATVFNPENPVPYFFLGKAYERRGDPNADAFYAYSVQLEPNFTDFMQGYDPNFDPRVIENYQGDPKEAIEQILPPPPPNRNRFHGEQGVLPMDGTPGNLPLQGTLPPPSGTKLPPPSGTLPPPTQSDSTPLPPPESTPLPPVGPTPTNVPPTDAPPPSTPPPPPPPTLPPPGLVYGKPAPQIGDRVLLFVRQVTDRTVVRSRTRSEDRTSSFGTGRRSGARHSSEVSTSDSSFYPAFSLLVV